MREIRDASKRAQEPDHTKVRSSKMSPPSAVVGEPKAELFGRSQRQPFWRACVRAFGRNTMYFPLMAALLVDYNSILSVLLEARAACAVIRLGAREQNRAKLSIKYLLCIKPVLIIADQV